MLARANPSPGLFPIRRAAKPQSLALPPGKTPELWVNARRGKYSALPKFGNRVCVAATRPKDKGRIAIVTNAGRAAVGADDTGAKGFCRAGNRE